MCDVNKGNEVIDVARQSSHAHGEFISAVDTELSY